MKFASGITGRPRAKAYGPLALLAVASTQYYCAATLDGYIADSDDGLGWLFGYEGSFEGEDLESNPMADDGAYERFYDGVGALVSGSTTYEFVIDHMEAGAATGRTRASRTGR